MLSACFQGPLFPYYVPLKFQGRSGVTLFSVYTRPSWVNYIYVTVSRKRMRSAQNLHLWKTPYK